MTGVYIVEELAERGHQVTGIGRNPAKIPCVMGVSQWLRISWTRRKWRVRSKARMQ